MTERPAQTLTTLDCGKWHLRAPLMLWQTESGVGYVVGNHVVQLCGTGDTPEEALEDYCRNLIEFAERIERQHGRLMEIMAADGQPGQVAAMCKR
jgi:hypothetical protein